MRRGVLTREVEFLTRAGRRVVVRSTGSHRCRPAPGRDALRGPCPRRRGDRALLGAGHARSRRGQRRPPARQGLRREPARSRTRDRGARAVLELTTRNSGLRLACAIDHRVDGAARIDARGRRRRARRLRRHAGARRRLRLEKFAAYHWADAEREGLAERARGTLDRAARAGYDRVERAHRRRVNAFWRRSDVVIEGAPEIQKAVRFNLFSLLQATGAAQRPRPAGEGRHRAAATRATTSGTPRSTSSRS